MESSVQLLHLLPGSEWICFVVPRAFSVAACEQLLTQETKQNFQTAHTHYPTYYRNNERLVVDSPALADYLFQTIRAVLPPQLPADAPDGQPWQLKQLNTRLRFCRYAAGQYFHRHLDGVYHQSATVKSRLTFMIYLNDATEFQGGRTLFYRSKDDPEVWAEYTPVQGDLIVFDHRIWHEGEELVAGEKFVLRSDILYETTSPPAPIKPTLPFSAGHLGYIWQVLPLGEQVVSAGRDTSIKVWNQAGVCVQELRGHQNSILSLCALTPDTLLSGSRDTTIKVWQRQEGGELYLTQTLNVHSATVLSLARLTDTTFISSSADGQIKVLDVEGRVLQTLAGHTDWVWRAVPLSEKIVVSASEDNTLKVWNWRLGMCLSTLPGGASPVHALLVDAGGRRLVCGDFAGEISVFVFDENLQSLRLDYTFAAHRGIVRTLAWLDDGRLVSGGEDNKVIVWCLRTRQCQQEMLHTDFVQSVAWLPARQQLISASYDGTLKLWTVPAHHLNSHRNTHHHGYHCQG